MSQGERPLHKAARKDHDEVAKALLEVKAKQAIMHTTLHVQYGDRIARLSKYPELLV